MSEELGGMLVSQPGLILQLRPLGMINPHCRGVETVIMITYVPRSVHQE